VQKYTALLRKLSRHDDDVINFDADGRRGRALLTGGGAYLLPHARTIALLLLADAVGTGTSGPSGDPVA